MDFQDQTLTCKDCGNTFVWSASEQSFYQQKGFQAPVRCSNCRAAKRSRLDGGGGQSTQHEITCASCGKKDTVPFVPRGDKPVLCRDCFRAKRNA
ncbi:MAG: zinc-binding protein [Candidatus Levybacteria bacterium RIFCSPHIGHO2_02_FULL_42_12]|nr:MAG: zinc-binding protein [Candidatus Levybacteria bacterium RIFCSPHIGHO2_01_FULL_42_15]OGH30810.1 MAG: zinc-binding protein [Candidatus Levybacteria bacterium RIFCSPHIGHO2_02_FULL_42_12]OGH42739.1 MAG: zinc-binding protein [Candidatus Levybacteria bacterium RIFCSPLOWO2_01_FULL_42_15]